MDSATQREPSHLSWGAGVDDPRPGLFKVVTLTAPARPLAGIEVTDTGIWETGDAMEMIVAASEPAACVIKAQAGSSSGELAVKPSTDGAVQRFRVRYPAAQDRQALKVSIVRPGDNRELATVEAQAMVADAQVKALLDRLDQLIAADNHPLFARHLRSVKAIVQTEWARATLYKKTNPALAEETMGYIRQLQRGFAGTAAQFESYLQGKHPLMLSFISRRDATVQWYALMLPKAFDPRLPPEKQPALPLFSELHGAGNPHYLNASAAFLGRAEEAASGLLGYERPFTYAMQLRSGYAAMPFGRGNSGYRDIGETDVWEAYDDIHQTFNIDANRRYLFGFSMGGAGTWNLGSRTPDRWAAIAVLGMGARVEPWGQAKNVAHTPIYIWGGQTDVIAFRGSPKETIESFAAVITAAGGAVQASSTPNVGHTYLGEKQEESTLWLSKHTRKRPDQFAFVADTAEHCGVWGITMLRDLKTSAFPELACRIEGQTVTIDTQGTPGITVDLGPDGLQMSGNVKVIWNGQTMHEGPVNEPGQPLVLGQRPVRGRR